MPPSEKEAEEERQHFARVVMTFRSSRLRQLSANNKRRKDVFRLPRADIELIRGLRFREKLEAVDRAILENAYFLLKIVENPEMFGHDVDYEEYESDEPQTDSLAKEENGGQTSSGHNHDHGAGPSHNHSHSHSSGHTHSQPHQHGAPNQLTSFRPGEGDMDKLRSTLKQLVRDWSLEGKSERDACYEPIKEALLDHFKHVQQEERSRLRVLVPGAGLGRLAFDVAQLGFASQGNEFSHYMLLASYFVLNQTTEVNQHRIYPYIHSFSNVSSKSDILRPIAIPDVSPSSLPPNTPFSLVAGDFEEVYGGESDPEEPQHGLWDAVLTCFFIDTAKNIVNYLRIIHKILAPGGVWINLGPSTVALGKQHIRRHVN
ncbi:hypothetical protein D9756_008538 [Leucocoprinus leucothites]|uniref:carnosine N-methyltransferase n=1 Tax=Leucocoprinus leucothites TaxID=201217 RepID=A0A8H5D1M5_9AGAR|nr:hypothetical protein D9756_008538 [Leucoagaricus leucothites]